MRTSRDPLTGIEFELPSSNDDRAAIAAFLDRHRGKRVVVVQGLGFVGAVMSLVCANAISEEYAVIGVDLATPASYWRIGSLNEGRFPLVANDPQIETFFQSAIRKGNFFATHDPVAYSYADVVIVDVNLDVQKDSGPRGEFNGFDVDLSGFRAAMRSIGETMRADALVLVETTIPPGTCKTIVKPILDEELGKRAMPTDGYRLGHSYERVMPGPEYIDSIRAFPRAYSGIDNASAESVRAFLETIIDTSRCNLTRLGSTNASEMAKVLENSYRAMNIAFVVEWSRFAEEAGVNLYEVVDAIRVRKTHANLMFPGIGVGGYCLTKDPLLASWSRQNLLGGHESLGLSERSVATNDAMPLFAFNRLTEVYGDLSRRRVAVLGVSYRGDVGDTRFSPVETFVRCLEGAGAFVRCHDPFVAHWPERDMNVEQDLRAVLDDSPDIVVIAAGHSLYRTPATIGTLIELAPATLFDTIGLLSDAQIRSLSERHRISVLGRGDLGNAKG